MAAGTLDPSQLAHACSWEPGEIGGVGDVVGAQKSRGSRPFARFFRRNDSGSAGTGKLSKNEAAALLRQAQHEAAFLRSLVQEQAARLQLAAEEAGAAAVAASAATAAEREREQEQQRWREGGGVGGGSALLSSVDRQQRQEQQQQQQLLLQHRLNYLEVRHELLIDLWTLRVLDNEVLGQQHHCWAGAGAGGGGHG